MTWGELKRRVDRTLRPDTEILTFKVSGNPKASDLIVWISPRTSDAEVHTVAMVLSPPKKIRKVGH